MNTENLIEKSKKIHNNRYDYSLTNFINESTKIKIICPVHGVFEQNPRNHQRGRGCRSCSKENAVLDGTKVIKHFKTIHGDKYDYSLVDYQKSSIKVKIICQEHGTFEQTPSNHKKGQGCKKCANIKAKYDNTITNNQAILNFTNVHGDKYDYSLVKYKSKKRKVKIICQKHGVFEQTPSNHKLGEGCPECSISGFSTKKSAILYYLKFKNVDLYKIGVTNRSVGKRFSVEERAKFNVVKIFDFVNGQKCYDTEQAILSHFKEFRYDGTPLLKSGNTEIFIKNILSFTAI